MSPGVKKIVDNEEHLQLTKEDGTKFNLIPVDMHGIVALHVRPSDVSYEWMFADAGKGYLGFSEIAAFNPLRWSGKISEEEAITQISAASEKDARPIRIKQHWGKYTAQKDFDTAADAAA